MITKNLDLTKLIPSQSQKEVTINESLIRIDAILNIGAVDRDVNMQPVFPSDGDLYIIGSSPVGDWSGHALDLAYYQQKWQFITPNEGMSIWVKNEKKEYRYTNGGWQISSFISEASGEFWQHNRLEANETGLSGSRVITIIKIPSRSIVYAVHILVTSAVTGASNFKVGILGDNGLFGSGIGIAINSTNIGIINPKAFYSDTDIILTANNGNFTGGDVKLVMHYHTFRGP